MTHLTKKRIGMLQLFITNVSKKLPKYFIVFRRKFFRRKIFNSVVECFFFPETAHDEQKSCCKIVGGLCKTKVVIAPRFISPEFAGRNPSTTNFFVHFQINIFEFLNFLQLFSSKARVSDYSVIFSEAFFPRKKNNSFLLKIFLIISLSKQPKCLLIISKQTLVLQLTNWSLVVASRLFDNKSTTFCVTSVP